MVPSNASNPKKNLNSKFLTKKKTNVWPQVSQPFHTSNQKRFKKRPFMIGSWQISLVIIINLLNGYGQVRVFYSVRYQVQLFLYFKKYSWDFSILRTFRILIENLVLCEIILQMLILRAESWWLYLVSIASWLFTDFTNNTHYPECICKLPVLIVTLQAYSKYEVYYEF